MTTRRVTPLAHRGGSLYPPNVGIENTMAAFGHAAALGCPWIETDVQASADGVAMLFHDADLGRLTGVMGAIGDHPADGLAGYLVGGREPVARLSEALEGLPGVRFNIDVKSDAAIVPVVEAVRAAGAVGRVRLASFSHGRLRAVRRMLPGVATSCSSLEALALKAGPVKAIWSLAARGGADAVQVPARWRNRRVVTPRFLDRAHALGLEVHVWTVNEPQEMTRLLDLGADGIVTDRIDLLKDLLVDRGQWPWGRTDSVCP